MEKYSLSQSPDGNYKLTATTPSIDREHQSVVNLPNSEDKNRQENVKKDIKKRAVKTKSIKKDKSGKPKIFPPGAPQKQLTWVSF